MRHLRLTEERCKPIRETPCRTCALCLEWITSLVQATICLVRALNTTITAEHLAMGDIACQVANTYCKHQLDGPFTIHFPDLPTSIRDAGLAMVDDTIRTSSLLCVFASCLCNR